MQTRRSVFMCAHVCVQPKSDRSIELLHALCSCDGNPVASNQDSVRDTVFGSARQQLLLSLEVRENVVFILPTSDFSSSVQWIPLSVFAEQATSNYFEYFLAFVKLCAELCSGRNEASLAAVSQAFPKPAVLILAALSETVSAKVGLNHLMFVCFEVAKRL